MFGAGGASGTRTQRIHSSASRPTTSTSSWETPTKSHLSPSAWDCLGFSTGSSRSRKLLEPGSSQMRYNWRDSVGFVKNLIEKVKNPDLMMSIITVSKRVNVLMLPTADEETIKSATQELQYEVADGQLNVDEGIKKANEMIMRSNSGAKKVFSVMIVLIGSPIPEAKYQLALEEAKNARKMGTVMFGVGINQYQKFQLDKIVDSSEHIFGQQGTARNLPSYIPKLLEKLCIRLDSLEPSSVCMGESPDVRVHGNGFLTAVTTESVICKFKFSRTNIDGKYPPRSL
ncbi:anthrax toxin receptor 1-like isoform X2 [Choloepus didactylus]|uniref:anthrax toxin receptor 1-like isoform X2 n=1 Tax=Choloepus didactylus TaxID=27675 RepID=UPI00189D30FF|nr:anthrax toxin receptor 1-like isoform X2 [Choloepus didactylus]